MALPTSGQLTLNDINVELGNSSGSQASLRSMSSTAGFSTPDTVSEFYGYSAGDTITLSWSSYPGTNYNGWGYYRTANHTGQTSATTISIYYTYSFTAVGGGTAYLKYSKNSTSTWYTIASTSSSTSGSYQTSSVTYTDVIRILWYNTTGSIQGNVSQFNGGIFTVGSGTITGNSTWLVT
jgi:hypothetical protein